MIISQLYEDNVSSIKGEDGGEGAKYHFLEARDPFNNVTSLNAQAG